MNEESAENKLHNTPSHGSQFVLVVLFWLFAGVPLGWGVYNTLLQAIKLFE